MKFSLYSVEVLVVRTQSVKKSSFGIIGNVNYVSWKQYINTNRKLKMSNSFSLQLT